MSGDVDEFELYDVREADEVHVTVGEKGIEDEDESLRLRGLKRRDDSNQTNHQC